MLKITITENRWVLLGQLTGPWVDELRRCWKAKHTVESRQRCIVDLNDVTLIDKSGERFLRAISKKGAELIANGIYTKHLIEKLMPRKSGLSKLLPSSWGSC